MNPAARTLYFVALCLTVALAIMVVISILSGCAATRGAAVRTGKIVFSCAGESVKAKVPEVLPVVDAIVGGQSQDWRAMLTGLVRELGAEVIACSLGRIAAGPAESTMRALVTDPGPDRAMAYLTEQDWSIAPEDGP